MNMTVDPRAIGPRIRMMLPGMTPSEVRITEILLRGGADALPLKALAAVKVTPGIGSHSGLPSSP